MKNITLAAIFIAAFATGNTYCSDRATAVTVENGPKHKIDRAYFNQSEFKTRRAKAKETFYSMCHLAWNEQENFCASLNIQDLGFQTIADLEDYLEERNADLSSQQNNLKSYKERKKENFPKITDPLEQRYEQAHDFSGQTEALLKLSQHQYLFYATLSCLARKK